MDKPRLLSLFGIGAGIVVGGLIIFLIQSLSPHQPPADMNWEDPQQVRHFIQNLPQQAFLIVLMSYFLGAATGGWLTNLIARPTRYRPALITGIGLLVFGWMNMYNIPHPTWFVVAASILFLAGAWLGGRVSR